MNWSDKYIGIPFVEGGRDFHGCDCGGLVLLVLRCEKGIIGRDFTAYELEDFKTRRGLMTIGKGIDAVVAEEWEPVSGEPRAFDLLRFNTGKASCHVGIYVGDGRFLHVESGRGQTAHLECLNSLVWGPKLFAVCRHRALTGGK